MGSNPIRPRPLPDRGAYRFGGFTLDLTGGALTAADGAEIALRPKSFTLLCHLVENAGRLLGREELTQVLWPGVFVTEDSLVQCVKEVRRALRDDERRLLRTLPRRGYLFAAAAICSQPRYRARQRRRPPSVRRMRRPGSIRRWLSCCRSPT